MKLDSAFVKLPLQFDVDRMVQEASQFDESAWQPHPGKHPGNTALPLISYGGRDNDDFHGTMLETPHLQKCEYIRQIFSGFGEVFGRSRFMRLAGGCEVPQHVDANYHWYRSVRIHVPVITNDQVIFHCGDEAVNMKAGECWLFDAWRNHKVVNHSEETRIHLVLDTAGSSRFWDIVDNTLAYKRANGEYPEPQHLAYTPGKPARIMLEKYNLTPVLSPGEVDGLVEDIIAEMNKGSKDASHVEAITRQMQRFCQDWRMIFSVFGYEEKGIDQYLNLMKQTQATLTRMPFDVELASNAQSAKTVLFSRVFSAAISPAVRQAHSQALTSQK